ncbi:histone-lysine N-methyltransferase PR-Set7 [Anopheles cruzii]|uniref:histone-lysine N-methyltransferase PR-Set7 n=1 Tax=Anopheles cruzii TaxID=68878 RepID=UPI0022EC6CA4|nr:histone-lysine N-methyltransferase PR-Set7 [Anopheles cruzii]
MIKGRRARAVGGGTKKSGSSSAKSCPTMHEDTASPKRKDLKFDRSNNEQHTATGAALANKSSALSNEPMLLRGGRRTHTSDISRYLQTTVKSKNVPTVQPLAASRANERFVDITDENTCDAFDAQHGGDDDDDDDLCITAITHPSDHGNKSNGPRKSNNHNNNNNNIFLQEPVLSLNFEKTPTSPTRACIILQSSSFLASADLKSTLFSSPSQPKNDSPWNGIVTSPNCQTRGSDPDQPQTPIKSLEHPFALDLSKPTQVTQIDSTTSTAEMCLHQEDSNSCDSGDSGVVILSVSDANTTSSSSPVTAGTRPAAPFGANVTDSVEKRKKPSTPHRILCPSPVKNAIVCLPTAGGTLVSSLGNNQKSRRAGSTKSRKRLNIKNAENAPGIQPLTNGNQAGTFSAEGQGENSDAMARQLIVVPLPSRKPTIGGNKKITEFYPVRRSVRKTKKEVQVERDRDIELAIRDGREEGLKIEHFEGKGRGIVTTRSFSKGEFVVEYIGDLITVAEAKQREQSYAEDDNTGCYMYYFKHKNIQHCIDATAESGKLGRLVNHSRNGNLLTKTVSIDNRPHLVLIAKDDIEKGVEVTYDYGDRSKEALQYYPWLAL